MSASQARVIDVAPRVAGGLSLEGAEADHFVSRTPEAELRQP